ncbi:MAG: hypothetical protein D6726_01170 [Nitrospirae bacterium]|nr:MAG: hypothetical protein D6726_01170 [Nitrospirota bacterium]
MLLGLCLVFTLSSCAKTMRYSYEEIKNFPPEIQEHIKNSEVVTGMTYQQVRYAWGPPNTVKVLDPTADGKDRVQWEYKRTAGIFKTILRFTDGKLTEIISTEPGIAK